VRSFESRQLSSWMFKHYLAIAPPSFVGRESLPKRGGASRPAPLSAS
jgi:hypothetical protein